MRVSLRAMVLWTFTLLVLWACALGLVSIAATARSARQVTSLETRSLEPTVSLALVSQYLDQERALITLNLDRLDSLHVGAVNDELISLDDSISSAADHVLTPEALSMWRTAWPAYVADRGVFIDAVRGDTAPRFPGARRGAGSSRRPQPQDTAALDRLNTVLDIVQSDAGRHLYAGQNLYRTILLDDQGSIRAIIEGFLAALLIGSALAALITRRLRNGLRNLLAATKAITGGALHVRAAEDGRDELGTIAAAFNHMTDALLSAERRADSDALTGLLNHRAFQHRLADAFAQARVSGEALSVLMLDVNNFKLFNDTYGHLVGDQVLTTVANLLRGVSRDGDLIARYGGDEFVLLARGADLAMGRRLAERLLDACAVTAIQVSAGTSYLPLTLSIGVAAFPDDAASPPALMEAADRRLFDCKRDGSGVNAGSAATPAIRLSPNAPFSVLDGLVTAIDHKDAYTRVHSEWVARFADLMAQALDFSTEARQRLWMAALIHDVGKIGIPDHILRKPAKLTDEEYAAMKQHVVLSELIVGQVLPTPEILNAVRYHHERWDGRGYPHGLAGTDVPLEGRIMILADAASAMYMTRPYRKGLSREVLVEELRRNRGTQFDPELADRFIAALLAPDSPLAASGPAGHDEAAAA